MNEQTNRKVDKDFFENDYGVRICKCCASCYNKEYRGDSRFCTIRKHKVDSGNACRNWMVSDKFRDIGSVQGSVKDIKYMNFMLNNFIDERHKSDMADDKGEIYTPLPSSYFRSLWLDTHDTIYSIP